MIKKIASYLIALIFIGGCSQGTLVKETRTLMDTFCEISCYGTSRDEAIPAIDEAFKEMERIESVFSKFNETGEVSKINKQAFLDKLGVSREVFNLTERSVYYSRISEGAFDITVAPLMDTWDFYRKNKAIPDKEAIEKALEGVGYRNIGLDSVSGSIKFLNKNTKLDFGGIAKGYAVDRAKDILISRGIKDGLINLGGNIFALGNAPGGKNWKTGVLDPRNKGKLLHNFELTNRAISTSGNYERFFEIEGKRYSHIINPVTGVPCQGIISVTVVADSAEEADALSTAIFVMGEEKGLQFAKFIKNIKVLMLKEEGRLIVYPR